MSAKADQLKLQARWQVWSVTGPEPDYSFFWALFSLAKEPSLAHLSVRPNIMVNRLKKKNFGMHQLSKPLFSSKGSSVLPGDTQG